MNNDDIFPVVVIGGGLAGLCAALHLAARDVPPLLLEADLEWPGGRLAGGAPDTFAYGGRTWQFGSEHGAHALWGAYDNMRATLDRFIDIALRESEGEEWINRWGNAPDMMRDLKERSITLRQAQGMSEEGKQGKIVRGVFVDRDTPEYTRLYDRIIEQAQREAA